MTTGDQASGPGARPRARKPTVAERRERRAGVEDMSEVLDAAARFLEARPRSVAEVRRRLTTAGYRPTLVEAVVTRLIELGYLDDDAFARGWVESRDRARPRGQHALRRELSLKGVDRTIVDEVLRERGEGALAGSPAAAVPGMRPGTGPDDAPGSADEAAADRLLRKKLAGLLREQDPRRRRQRAYALLARNGFSPDVCGSVTRRVLDDEAGGHDAEHADDGDDSGVAPPR